MNTKLYRSIGSHSCGIRMGALNALDTDLETTSSETGRGHATPAPEARSSFQAGSTMRRLTARVAAVLTLSFAIASMAWAQGGLEGPPPGPPGGGARSYKLSGAYTLSSGTEGAENKTYKSSSNDVSAVYVNNGAELTLVNPTIETSGDTTSQENSSFYGLNAAVLATQGSKVTISDGSVTTSGTGANGVFAAGSGAEISLSKVTIKATGTGGHGVMASGGGALTLTDVDIISGPGANSAAIATDRGGGTIIVTRGIMVTSGRDAPGIYSTGTIIVNGATIEGTAAEAAVIEGKNSITLTNCTLSGAAKCGVMIYQSFSGDAQGRKGTFTINGGSLTATAGPLFYVSNTKGVITLQGVNAAATSGTLVNASADRWGRSGSNGGNALFIADGESLAGDLTCDSISSITATLQNGTTLTGSIKGAALTLDSTSKWELTADSILTALTDPNGVSGNTITNIYGNGHDARYDASLPANKWLQGTAYALANGGHLIPNR